ncbi:hypothetical protein JKP88DRAFT_262336 [Tribonema minus]|uniref:Cytochrome b5 heme-binding domain-containing protein n=1 Tax=Tribonema minus TaxID=303371 RepID=A0A835Z6K8_9STRA|nr:hypothetical protein JKP88DRAFT_262336 [Tribonema minus]
MLLDCFLFSSNWYLALVLPLLALACHTTPKPESKARSGKNDSAGVEDRGRAFSMPCRPCRGRNGGTFGSEVGRSKLAAPDGLLPEGCRPVSHNFDGASFLPLLPDDLRLRCLALLQPEDLFELAQASKGCQAAADAEPLWAGLWQYRFGRVWASQPLQDAAERWHCHWDPLRHAPLQGWKLFFSQFALSWIGWAAAGSNTEERCILGINGALYNVTDFLMEHPGSPDTLLDSAGCDATQRTRLPATVNAGSARTSPVLTQSKPSMTAMRACARPERSGPHCSASLCAPAAAVPATTSWCSPPVRLSAAAPCVARDGGSSRRACAQARDRCERARAYSTTHVRLRCSYLPPQLFEDIGHSTIARGHLRAHLLAAPSGGGGSGGGGSGGGDGGGAGSCRVLQSVHRQLHHDSIVAMAQGLEGGGRLRQRLEERRCHACQCEFDPALTAATTLCSHAAGAQILMFIPVLNTWAIWWTCCGRQHPITIYRR